MKFIRKPDEMEKRITLLAQRNGYLFVMAALIIWTFYESWKVFNYHTPINLIPCGIMTVGMLIQSMSQLVMTRNAVKDDEDSNEMEPLIKLLVLFCVVAGIIATLVSALILMGAQQ